MPSELTSYWLHITQKAPWRGPGAHLHLRALPTIPEIPKAFTLPFLCLERRSLRHLLNDPDALCQPELATWSVLPKPWHMSVTVDATWNTDWCNGVQEARTLYNDIHVKHLIECAHTQETHSHQACYGERCSRQAHKTRTQDPRVRNVAQYLLTSNAKNTGEHTKSNLKHTHAHAHAHHRKL